MNNLQAKADALKERIRSWYRNANIDYGVVGRVSSIHIDEKADTITIETLEDGETLRATLYCASDDSAEQLYNIWMEVAQ